MGTKKVAYDIVSVLNGLNIVVFIEKSLHSINITCNIVEGIFCYCSFKHMDKI